MNNSFDSLPNRKTLWDIMSTNNIFGDIKNEHFEEVKRDFEFKVKILAAQANKKSLIDLNKECITGMISELEKYKVQAQAQAPQPLKIEEVKYITSADIQKQREKTFQNVLKDKQNEFNALNTRPIPVNIDFTDKVLDKPIGAEMDQLLADTIAWREKELRILAPPSVNVNANAKAIKNIKIGDEVHVDLFKKVTFQIENNDNDKAVAEAVAEAVAVADENDFGNIMSRLKQKPLHVPVPDAIALVPVPVPDAIALVPVPVPDALEEVLKRIELQQEKILTLLSSLVIK